MPITLGPLRHRSVLLLFASRLISIAGNGFGRVALAFAVLGIPHATPIDLSIVLAAQALPQLLFVLVGGLAADKFPRLIVLLVSEFVAFMAWSGIAAVLASGYDSISAMTLLAALGGTATAFLLPAFSGVMPEVAPRDELHQANAMLRLASNSGLILGFALAGLSVGLLGTSLTIGINAASFLASFGCILRIFISGKHRQRHSTRERMRLRDGWREFVSRQWLWVVVAQYTLITAAITATFGVLGPLVARDRLGGAPAWSLIVLAQAIGTVGGALLAMRVRARRPIFAATFATLPAALPMITLALRLSLWLIASSMFLAGIANDIFGVLWQTTMQKIIPPGVLSRVSSWDLLGALCFAPLGLAVAGPVAARYGASIALVGCAILVVLPTLAALLSPGVRNLTLSPPDESVRHAASEDVVTLS